ncbi:alpha/beta hydrolase [Pseudonocardia halophobica]|uniref:Oxidoreductase n=1 Tax=Pseudonocardia halophobica TaxID=29401 RepID=A0A9W6KXG6_9PSEU|nr:alpha/beta hydrolase [Pseudonocardia halophobica]GLL09796.1 oxidoreductase [Pseudonocardia halophobica]
MTVVLVHGVPETTEIWDGVRERLDRDSAVVALPGFGTERPSGFDGSKDAHIAWIGDRLAEFDEPVDLVGHDWGSILVLRAATAFPQRVRSWAVDIAAASHPTYEWHRFARLWQTPGTGEDWVRDTLAESTAGRVPAFVDSLTQLGATASDARLMAEHFDARMGAAILDLYRSAVPNVHAHWGIADPGGTARPGLVLAATADPFDDRARADEVAAALGAELRELPGLSHFWMSEDPAASAAMIDDWVRTRELS